MGLIQARKKSKTRYFAILHASFSRDYCLLPFFLALFFCLCFPCPFAFTLITFLLFLFLTDQRLDLNKLSPNDSDTIRGQIVGEYIHDTQQ